MDGPITFSSWLLFWHWRWCLLFGNWRINSLYWL